jgi:hypothetical protein
MLTVVELFAGRPVVMLSEGYGLLLFGTQLRGRKQARKQARVLRLCAMWDSFFSLKSQMGKK